jgi:xanthine dehydrogenase accessory factor
VVRVKELGDILAALRGLAEPAVLVTVVAVEGSTYRRPGARMLVSPCLPGGRIGCISGGCLEDEVCRRAMYITDKGPAVLTYETGLDDGAGPGYTLGCGGRVTAMFERVGAGLSHEYLRFIDVHRSAGRSCVVATVIGVDGDPGVFLGDRPLFLGEDGESVVGPGGEALLTDAASAIETGASRPSMMSSSGGRAHVLLEVVPAPVHLVLFGTGHDVGPVAQLAVDLGWKVTIVAKRTTDAIRARFPSVHSVVSIDEITARLDGPRRTAAIVMNHNYAQDSDSVCALLRSQAAYIGILGPRHRTDAMLSDVASIRQFDGTGVASRIDLSRVHAPIGLDIGAESPEEVALAIIAEVQAFFAGRDGGRLRDRPGAIHPAVEVKVAAPVIAAACSVDVRP